MFKSNTFFMQYLCKNKLNKYALESLSMYFKGKIWKKFNKIESMTFQAIKLAAESKISSLD